MIYLDTHIVVWLYVGMTEKFTPAIRQLINSNDLLISPIVHLELQYLHEVHRVTDDAKMILADLSKNIGLEVCRKGFGRVVEEALEISWTRDPFDRLIIAQASLDKNILVTKDSRLLNGYSHATW